VSEPHEVVKLLIKRMDSHPEEFKKDADRWDRVLVEVLEHADEAEIAAIHASVRNIRLGEAHEDMMDELCNGDERRRKEREEQEYEQTMIRQGLLAQQQKAYLNQLHGMVGQVYGGGGGGGGGAGIVGKSYTSAIMDNYDSDLDKYRNAVPTLYGDYGSATSALPVANGGTDNTIINQIKNMLKKGK